ncbi:hypothetical protein DFQ00_105251 [Paenibacillus barcinonensis]|uniref:Uncharacterized protein n=1 Tax=Paenibacillus barcinonensis TaxID=198119 RepID=A0A2V4VBI6_PAEBA|nr:hypothetical protein DFQ00_105251 [Paenibacillus barcinonensis]
MIPIPSSYNKPEKGGRIFKFENVLKLNEQLRASTTSAK